MKIENSEISLKTEECLESGNEENKKRRKRKATICTNYCKFDIVRRTAKNLGMKDVSYNDPWNVLWTDYSVSVAKIRVLKSFQRVNHFPGMAEICHKALLAKNLNRMAKSFPKAYAFFPKTWCFPTEYKDAVEYSKKHLGRTYILKPGAGCRGQGIQLTKNFRTLPPADKLICQLYLSKPFLVDGLKFDLRIYTLITSCNPLKIFIYNEGLARFATAPYRKPAGYNLANCYMHLTNYSVNKYSSTFVSDGECGSKRRLSCLNKWLSRNLYDVEEIWAKIDDVIIKTIISALPSIKHSYQVSFPNHTVVPACFEILGFDILLDNNLNPFVLEVNHSPSFNCDSKVDEEIKLGLLEDTFRLLNLAEMDTFKILEYEKKLAKKRLTNSNPITDSYDSSDPDEKPWSWQEGDIGNYRQVYPVKDKPAGTKVDPYRIYIESACCINLTLAENVSSNVREAVNKIQNDRLSEKDQLQHLLKVHSKQVNNFPEIIMKNKDPSKMKLDKSDPAKNTEHQTIKMPNDKSPEEELKKIIVNNQLKPKQVKEESKMEIQGQNNKGNCKMMPNDKSPEDKLKKIIVNNQFKPKQVKEESKMEIQGQNYKGNCKMVAIPNNKDAEDSRNKSTSFTGTDNKETNLDVANEQDGSNKENVKLFNRLQESGHMPGAFIGTSDSKQTSGEQVVKVHVTKHKSNHKRSRGYKILENSDLIEIAKTVGNREIKRNPVAEFTLRFQSRAASEFLKFQKLKLLKKFKDLT